MSAQAAAGRRRPPRASRGPAAARPPGLIRWDRLGRIALLIVLGAITLLYVSPVSHWVTQSRTANAQSAELRALERENERLKTRLSTLRSPDALEREARRLGMVRRGERAFVIQPGRR